VGTDGPTNGLTDQPTDTVSYRGATSRLKIQIVYHIQYLQFKFGNFIFFWRDFEITFLCTNFAQDWITNPENFQNSLISLFFSRDSENDLIFSVLTLKIGIEKNRKLSSKIGKISYDLTL
jgi:hypothetical protein